MNIQQKDFNATAFFKENAVLVIGLMSLILPTLYRLFHGVWQSDDQAHGPIIFAIVLWLFWQRKDLFLQLTSKPKPLLAFALMVPALLLYIVGRSQDILLLEIGAFIPLVAGVMVLGKGSKAFQVYWFALVFMLFLIPLPGGVVDAVTGALKYQVSHIAEEILYRVGYPVARNGVMLTVGQYQLLVADACSGMNSMFSLLAVGSLYVYLTQYASISRNILLIVAIIPIAFIANIVRVMILILVTYHFGDEAGQGFIHGFAGMMLFAIALIGMFFIDKLLSVVYRKESTHAK